MDRFAVGERVRLKTGGPDMTIIEGDPRTNKYRCEWLNCYGQVQSGAFPPEALCRADCKDG